VIFVVAVVIVETSVSLFVVRSITEDAEISLKGGKKFFKYFLRLRYTCGDQGQQTKRYRAVSVTRGFV
jgi:hypothetical protein